MNNREIGQNIKKLRLKKGLSQTELSKICNITPQAVSKWERGESIPDISSLENLSTLFNVSINNIIKSNFEIKKSNIKVLDLIGLTILIFVFIIFIFPFNTSGDYASGYRVIFFGYQGDLVFSLRLSFFSYISLLIVALLLQFELLTKNKLTLLFQALLILVTILNNGIAISQSMISVESISLLVGASVLLLIINVYEFLITYTKSGKNVSYLNTNKFSINTVLITLGLYLSIASYILVFEFDFLVDNWWVSFPIIGLALGIILFLIFTIFKAKSIIFSIIVLALPMIGVLVLYLVYALTIDAHVYVDDFFITLLIELVMSIPIVLIISKSLDNGNNRSVRIKKERSKIILKDIIKNHKDSIIRYGTFIVLPIVYLIALIIAANIKFHNFVGFYIIFGYYFLALIITYSLSIPYIRKIEKNSINLKKVFARLFIYHTPALLTFLFFMFGIIASTVQD